MISQHHLDMLAASGITAEFAELRGYETITDPRRLALLGYSKGAQRTPGLLIPQHTARGDVWGYAYRPDHPRERNGKKAKYEMPYRQANHIDVPPGVGPMLADPNKPLLITEGSKKADCAALRDLCCVSINGVAGWRGTNAAGGKTAVADFNDIALNGRQVILAFDGDVARKQPVQAELRKLADYLKFKDARVAYLHLPDTDDKTGLDDYLVGHTVEELWRLVKPDLPTAKTKPASSTPPNNSATAQPRRSTAMPEVALLRRILDAVADEVRSRGLVGEERLAQTLYLVLTSRLLDKQVSAGVKGHSASGKSYTVETVTRFFPPEAYIEFTAMSERALIYYPEKFAHRTLVIYEVTALREGVEDDMTSYIVRSLLSEGRIVYPVTVRDKDGGFVTKTIVKEGPTNLVFTTTKTRVHAENETRILSLATDDSREQTARVLLELADESNGARDLQRWHDLQRWLADAEHRVTIPYSHQLAQRVAPVAVRLRRDFGSLLALIRAHAILHQATRSRDAAGCIIATLDDYAVVRDLVADTIAEGVGQTVADTVRETVETVAALASKDGVMARGVAEKLRLDKSNVSRRLRMAADDGYLRNLEDKRGKPGRWVIGDPLPESVDLLPDPAQLATADTPVDLGGCAVAHESEGENGDPPTNSHHADQDGGLFEYAAHNGKVVDEHCACGNALLTPDAINSGKCKPCRDKLMAGYDQ